MKRLEHRSSGAACSATGAGAWRPCSNKMPMGMPTRIPVRVSTRTDHLYSRRKLAFSSRIA